MILKDFRTLFTSELINLYPKTEIDAFFFRIIEHYLNFSPVDVFTKTDYHISIENEKEMLETLAKLKKEEPIQYILGKTEFYGLPFIVNTNTLIPRPETEELVNWILDEIKTENLSLEILDIGTGTGCIPITIKKHSPNSEVSAIDISEKALDVAKKNAELNDVSINFIQQDILATNTLTKKYDVIVSNPPYVRVSEKKEMKNNVLENEPHLALFVSNENPLLFYDKITDLAKDSLTKNGMLFFEINQYLATETQDLLKQKGYKNITLKKDLFGNARMLQAFL